MADQSWPPGAELVAVAAADGPALLVDGQRRVGQGVLHERAAARDWAVAVDGFWQVHPAAADTLVRAVLSGVEPQPGERALDLYCGVGLFAGALADAGCRVWGVEGSRPAVQQARRNLADVAARVTLSAGRVERSLGGLPPQVDVVVLDPPRAGAGAAVMRAIATRTPRVIAYVACDPAALARDLATAATLGYRPVSITAYDLFPMTAHVECVAILQPEGDDTCDLTFVRSVTVARSVEDTFAYASDFNRAYEWRDEVKASSATPPGPMRLGTQLHEESVLAGRPVVTESVVDAYEAPHRWSFAHVSGPMAVSGDYVIAPVAGGAQLTYTLRVRLRGGWALLAPLFRLTGGRMIDRSLAKFAENLEAGPGAIGGQRGPGDGH